MSGEEAELRNAIEVVLRSPRRKKLVIAGPGTGKTTLFKQMLELAPGQPDERIVLTFINTLKDDLAKDLADQAQVFTLHSYCLGQLHQEPALRGSLSPAFSCFPGLAGLIADDWELIFSNKAPHFVGEMRSLEEDNHLDFYLARGEYYDAVDFDDCVYRALNGFTSGRAAPNEIISHLEDAGYSVSTRREPQSGIDRENGLAILKGNLVSNLGWRIILEVNQPPFLKEVVGQTAENNVRLVDVVPDEYRNSVFAEVDCYEPAPLDDGDDAPLATNNKPAVTVTSFEGAKGLSAQHVFIAGLHDGELPHDPAAVTDLEICKFVVGLTRTRKKCTLIHTGRFGNEWKSPSAFISWISNDRLDFIKVDKAYWAVKDDNA